MIRTAIASALACASLTPALASEAWEDIKYQLYEGRTLQDGLDVIAVDAPYRTSDDARTQIAAHIAAPTGLQLGKVTLVLDNNPMPVSAVFDLETPQTRFFFDVTMRINGPTPMHVIAETTDGQLWVAEGFVKTSGQGACAAPPGTDPKEALATLGNMELGLGAALPGASGSGTAQSLTGLALRQRRLDIDVQHPSHSGMQMDQISLLFIPMRYVENLDVDLDGAGYVEVTGSISLSENPTVSLSVPGTTQTAKVTMTDTSGTVTEAETTLTGY